MQNNLFQIRDAFFRSTVCWMFLTALLLWRPEIAGGALIAILVAWVLYRAIPANGNGAAGFANALAIWAYLTAAAAALLVADHLGLAEGWFWQAVAIGSAWALTGAYGLRSYNKLVTVPPGVMHVYTSLLGIRRVTGYAKIAPHVKLVERLQAVVPIALRRLDVDVTEIGTFQSVSSGVSTSGSDDRAPPGSRTNIHNIHRVQIGIEFTIDPSRFYSLLTIPRDDIVSQQRDEWGGNGQTEWHDPRFWAGLARGYLGELADELTRVVIHEMGWSAEVVWHRKDELGERLFEQLQDHGAMYGILVRDVNITNVVVDEPSALRRSRDLELVSETWQGQQARGLETFHETLESLGLKLTRHEIEALTRMQLLDMVRHLERYGNLDRLSEDLAIEVGGHGPNGPNHGGSGRRAA